MQIYFYINNLVVKNQFLLYLAKLIFIIVLYKPVYFLHLFK